MAPSSFARSTKASIKRRIDLVRHRGKAYTCPFCGYSAKDLHSIGSDFPVLKEKEVIGAGMRNAGCYSCGSTDRERLLLAFLRDSLHLEQAYKDKFILHVAPEKRLTKRLLEFGLGHYICGDLFTPGYEYAAHVKNMNILDIPYEANTFDLVICNHVLEHIPDDRKAMRELHRVLKPGGQAILQVPISRNSAKTFEDPSITDPKERIKAFGQFDHVRIYGQDYVDRLAECGFQVDRINLSGDYPQYGLNPDEDLFVAVKTGS